MTMNTPPYPSLQHPPLVEVVCGFFFEPLPELKPLVIGLYWSERRKEYPQTDEQSALFDNTSSPPPIEWSLGPGPLRVLMTSEDQHFVLQIQQDRLYFNWRRRDEGDYPRFKDTQGGSGGMRSRALHEWGLFSGFCERELNTKPQLTHVEISKVNQLVGGQHWQDPQDLAALFPALQAFNALTDHQTEGMAFVVEQSTQFDVPLRTHCAWIKAQIDDKPRQHIAISHNLRAPTIPEALSPTLTAINDTINRAFFRLLSPSELHRFSRAGGEP